MKQIEIKDGQIKKGNWVLVFSHYSNTLVKRKVLFVQKTFWNEDCYIIKLHRDMGIVYKNEISKIF